MIRIIGLAVTLLGFSIPFLLLGSMRADNGADGGAGEAVSTAVGLKMFLDLLFSRPGIAISVYLWGLVFSGGIVVVLIGLAMVLFGGRRSPRVIIVRQPQPQTPGWNPPEK